jgi:hypothetical protein
MSDTTVHPAPQSWLLLVHQLPPSPPYFRVKIWRRLQAMGAVAVKASVYALPQTDAAREDFQWLLKEIVAGDGEAMICEAQLVDGLADADVQALFDTARAADYEALIADVRSLQGEASVAADALADKTSDLRTQLARLTKRFGQIAAIDFFEAPGRQAVQALLTEVEARLRPAVAGVSTEAPPAAKAFQGRTWVTRQGVKVDRIACAWLIGAFIDPAAAFKFVPANGYQPLPGELRFDMFEAEFTHEGDSCSFEVLLDRMGLDDPGLKAIGEIVHDIDLKDAKFGREEAAGVAHMLDGLCRNAADDRGRIERGGALLADLLAYFRSTPVA